MYGASDNKIRISHEKGGGSWIGLINPIPGMTTQHGPILSLDSGNYTVVVGLGTGNTPQRFYPHDLYITHTLATGTYAFPTGDGSVKFSHNKGVLANGSPLAIGSGSAFNNGTSTVFTFGR